MTRLMNLISYESKHYDDLKENSKGRKMIIEYSKKLADLEAEIIAEKGMIQIVGDVIGTALFSDDLTTKIREALKY